MYLLSDPIIKNQVHKIKAWFDSNNEVNAITPAYTTQLDLKPKLTHVGTQKINDLVLETHNMILISFLLYDSLKRV